MMMLCVNILVETLSFISIFFDEQKVQKNSISLK